MEDEKNINGDSLAELMYSDRPKKKRIKKVEKVEQPEHWNPDVDMNELKRKQLNSQTNDS